jgi:hypothetical protein
LKNGVKDYYDKKCKGESHCVYDLTNSEVMGDIDFINNPDEMCSNDLAQFFIQYTCEQNKDLQKLKYDILAQASALVMFAALFFSRIVNYLKSTSLLD